MRSARLTRSVRRLAVGAVLLCLVAGLRSEAETPGPAYWWSHLAGPRGGPGSDDGKGAAASFVMPTGVAVDASGNVYVADTQNHTIRKITTTGVTTTLAGTAGAPGSDDGLGAEARFNQPQGVAVDGTGIIYVADLKNSSIRKISPAGVMGRHGRGSAKEIRAQRASIAVLIEERGNLTI